MFDIFFDLDGTLTDPAVGIVACFQHALGQLNAPSWDDEELKRFIGPPIGEVFREILGTDDPVLNERAITLYRERFSTVGLFENSVYPGIPEAVRVLHDAGARLWVVTSKPHVYAERIMDHFQLRPFFAGVYGAELSGERAHKVELLSYVIHQEGMDPSRACMIGDRRHDIEAARAHHVPALGVLWGYGTRLELESAGANSLVNSVPELPAAVSQLSADVAASERLS